MTLLNPEGRPKTPKHLSGAPVTITRWPKERKPEGMGLSVKDGWNFGVGFGLALTIALPLILVAVWGLAYLALAILGITLGSL